MELFTTGLGCSEDNRPELLSVGKVAMRERSTTGSVAVLTRTSFKRSWHGGVVCLRAYRIDSALL
jgi:hypothetical protein